MKTHTQRSNGSCRQAFACSGLRFIGGTTGAHATERDAVDVMRLWRMLQTRVMQKPFAQFALHREEDESDPTDGEWLQIVKQVMTGFGAADAMWWDFAVETSQGRYALNICALLIDSTGKPLASRRCQLGRLNADGSRRVRAPKERSATPHAPDGVL